MTQQQLSRMIEESGEAIDRLLDDLQVELAKYRRAYDRFERTGIRPTQDEIAARGADGAST